MQNKFQYIILGVAITLLTILGVMSLALSRAEAKVNPDVPNSEIALQQPESQEVNNLHLEQEQNQTGQLQMGSSLSPETAETGEAEVVLAHVETLIEEVEVVSTNDVGATDDREVIVNTVAAFASKQEENLFGKSGWIYEKYLIEMFLPEGQVGQDYHLTTGETIPMELLAPNRSIFESWYHVDGNNTFFEGVSLVSSTDGVVHQKSVLIGEEWVNLTLKEANAHPGQYVTRRASNIVTLPTIATLHTLKTLPPVASVQASWGKGQYIITIEYSYTEPLEDAAFMPEPIIGNKHIYVFDLQTGQLLTIDGYTLFQSNKWFHDLSMIYNAVQFQETPPAVVTTLFIDAINAYMEGK